MNDNEIASTERTKVGFPEASVPEEKKGFNFGALLVFLLILILVGGGVWFMFFRNKDSEIIMEETPTETVEEVVEESTPTIVQLNKSSLKIQILNGSGIAGLAGKLQTSLESAGYSGIETGNADSYTYKTTVVAFGSSVSSDLKTDLNSVLEKIYGTLDSKANTSSKYDVVITIGSPNAATPTTSVSKTSPSPTASVTKSLISVTVTPTKKPTSTVTPTP